MSLDGRLKQGLSAIADNIDVDYELWLVRVQAVARQRERRNVMIAAFAGAAAALALAMAGGKLADMVLSIEVPMPTVREPQLNEDGEISEVNVPNVERLPEDGLVDDDNLEERQIAVALGRDVDDADPDAASGSQGSSERGRSTAAAPQNKPQPAPVTAKEEKEPAAPRTRTVSADYAGSAVPIGGGASACDNGQTTAGCVTFQTEPGERFLELSISDTSGGTVFGWVQIDRDGDDSVDGEWIPVCGQTTRPIRIPSSGDAVVHVEINGGACPNGTDSNPTRGTVNAVFAT